MDGGIRPGVPGKALLLPNERQRFASLCSPRETDAPAHRSQGAMLVRAMPVRVVLLFYLFVSVSG